VPEAVSNACRAERRCRIATLTTVISDDERIALFLDDENLPRHLDVGGVPAGSVQPLRDLDELGLGAGE
jgi:hypothetical protein